MKTKFVKNSLVKNVKLGISFLAVFINLSCVCNKSVNQYPYTGNPVQILELIFEAIKSYTSDTYTLPDANNLLISLLQSSNVDGWNGPYISKPLEVALKSLENKYVVEKTDENTIEITLTGNGLEFASKDKVVGIYTYIYRNGWGYESLKIAGDGVGYRIIRHFDD